MNIGIDLRPLATAPRTGIGEYTFGLLNALLALDKTNQYFLFCNSSRDVSISLPQWKQDNVHYLISRWPNKIFNTSLLLTGRPRLDRMIEASLRASPPRRASVAIPRLSEPNLLRNTWGLLRRSPPAGGFAPRNDAAKIDIFYSPNLNFTSLSKNIKHILTFHDLSFKIFPEFYTPRQRLWHRLVNPKKQCRRADIILTPSENTKRDIIDLYQINPDKIKVIYPGISPVIPSEASQPTRNLCPSFGETEIPPAVGMTERIKLIATKYNLPQNFILFLGTIEPRKNIIGLIDAFERAYDLGLRTYSLVIAGAPGWKNKKIYKRADRSPLKDKIKIINYIEPHDKYALYAAASLFVYPSLYEGFGFPVLEAMATGTPVITSNRSSLPEITGSAAYLINPNKPAEIALGMARLLGHSRNPSSNSHYSQQKKDGLLETAKFTWEKAAQNFLNLLG